MYLYTCVGVFQTEFALSNDLQAGSGPNKKHDMHQFPECFQKK
jgi:hypothetical protein